MSVLPPELSENESRLIRRIESLQEQNEMLMQALADTRVSSTSADYIRTQALEDAAKVVERLREGSADSKIRVACVFIASEIRALSTSISQPELSEPDLSTYEDQLPADMPPGDYGEWWWRSRVVDGVRMGPKYPFASPERVVDTPAEPERPKIICLCGSTRFVDTWVEEYQRLSDAGNIVLTVARMPPRPNLQRDEPELKQRLDELHKRKIDLADEVFVLDVNGYIGESTRNEIEYAKSLGKPIRYLSGDAEILE